MVLEIGWKMVNLTNSWFDSAHHEKKLASSSAEAAELREKLGDLRGLGVIYNNMGEMYMMKKSYVLARQYFMKALAIAQKTNYTDFRQHVYKMLSESFAHEKDFKKALTYFEMHTKLKDSLFNETRSRQLLELETKYETEKKEQQIALQKAQLSEQAAQLERNYAVFAILALLLAFLFLVFHFYRVQLAKKQEFLLKKAELNASITSQEQERKRFAQDIHDGMGQLISACRLQLSNLANSKKPQQKRTVNEKVDRILLEMHREIRNIAFNLMPGTLIQSGLAPAIKELSERINETNGLRIRVFDFEMQKRLTETREIFLYRAVQEWLNNIIKHAQAKRVEIQILNHSDELLIMIEDDGKGFDPRDLSRGNGNGWSNIQSRLNHIGAKVDIDSKPGFIGTTFVITVPEPFSANGAAHKN